MKNLMLVIIVFLSFKSTSQVTSVAGTANQVIASGSTGAVTLSLPQSIAFTSTPLFAKLGLGPSGVSTVVSLYNTVPITGSTTAYGNLTTATIQSAVTSAAFGNRTYLSTAATSFILGNLYHYSAGQNIIGAGSSITNQYGFLVEANLIGATGINAGFAGRISSGANRWNLYMSGSASNYLASNLGIGTTNPTEKLSVNGNIRAKEVSVEATPWPDYVFHKDYSLLPLSELEKFIKMNKHLPEIPSAKETEENGVNLGEMDASLLKKVEELTLYLIAQDKSFTKQFTILRKEIDQLKSRK